MTYMIVIVSILAATLTYLINNKTNKGPVFASAIVALSSGIILPYLFKESGTTLAVVATCGSYAAMVSKDKFPRLRDMLSVGIICGIVFILAQDVFVGVGGRLGAIGAISGFTWLGMKKIVIGNREQRIENR